MYGIVAYCIGAVGGALVGWLLGLELSSIVVGGASGRVVAVLALSGPSTKGDN